LSRENPGKYLTFSIAVDFAHELLVTGTTIVNNTLDRTQSHAHAAGKDIILYGVTAAGVSGLLGIERICPRGR
jgi:hypothetical protein